MATLPLVAWHFGRISLVGIPVTLLVTPLIVLAIPGIFTSLLLALVHPGSARFLASGVEPVLQLLLEAVERAASLPFASVWVSQAMVLAGSGALGAVGLLVLLPPSDGGRQWASPPRVVGGGGDPGGTSSGSAPGLGGDWSWWSWMWARGTPPFSGPPEGGGSWWTPAPERERFDAGDRTVLPYLRRRGVSELELLILTHPDMDHVGGAASVLDEFPVGAVLDPGVPAGTEAFLARPGGGGDPGRSLEGP